MAGRGGGETVRVELSGGLDAPTVARNVLTERLAGRLTPARLEELRLLVTELVSNSVRHGGVDERGTVRVRVELTAERARVEVSEAGPPAPRPGEAPVLAARTPDLGGGGGFGLYLVDRVALCWGAVHEPGLRVWFELARS